MTTMYYTADDVKQILGCSLAYAYKIIALLNADLRDDGYIALRGKIPKTYFKKKLCLGDVDDDKI